MEAASSCSAFGSRCLRGWSGLGSISAKRSLKILGVSSAGIRLKLRLSRSCISWLLWRLRMGDDCVREPVIGVHSGCVGRKDQGWQPLRSGLVVLGAARDRVEYANPLLGSDRLKHGQCILILGEISVEHSWQDPK